MNFSALSSAFALSSEHEITAGIERSETAYLSAPGGAVVAACAGDEERLEGRCAARPRSSDFSWIERGVGASGEALWRPTPVRLEGHADATKAWSCSTPQGVARETLLVRATVICKKMTGAARP